MPDARFESLRLELLRSGVAPVYVDRTILELGEHYDDLECAARAAGLSAEEAARSAQATLGNPRVIATAILARTELLTFSMRWPRVAHYLQSAATPTAAPQRASSGRCSMQNISGRPGSVPIVAAECRYCATRG